MTAELDVPFAVVRRGYDRGQVDDSLARLTAELEAAAAGRAAANEDMRGLSRQLEASRNEAQAAAAAAAEARADVQRLRAQVAELSTVPTTVDGMSERLQQMVRIAQDEVNDMRTRATISATQVLTLAQAEADELRERSAAERQEFEDERAKAEESLGLQLEESQARLEQFRSDSSGQKARLDAELAEHRAQAEQEFATEMEQRRTAVLRELGSQEARHREEAARIVDAATQEARTRLAEATAEAQRVRAQARDDVSTAHREFEELRALQHQVSEQLTSVRALLDWTLPQIGANATRAAANGAIAAPATTGSIAAAPVAADIVDQRPSPTAKPTAEASTSLFDTAQAAPAPPAPTRTPSPSPVAAEPPAQLDRPTPVARHALVADPRPNRTGTHR